MNRRVWDKSPSLSIVFELSSKTQWLSGLYYADFISFYSPTQLCGGGTTKSNSNELPISVPLSFLVQVIDKGGLFRYSRGIKEMKERQHETELLAGSEGGLLLNLAQ